GAASASGWWRSARDRARRSSPRLTERRPWPDTPDRTRGCRRRWCTTAASGERSGALSPDGADHQRRVPHRAKVARRAVHRGHRDGGNREPGARRADEKFRLELVSVAARTDALEHGAAHRAKPAL